MGLWHQPSDEGRVTARFFKCGEAILPLPSIESLEVRHAKGKPSEVSIVCHFTIKEMTPEQANKLADELTEFAK